MGKKNRKKPQVISADEFIKQQAQKEKESVATGSLADLYHEQKPSLAKPKKEEAVVEDLPGMVAGKLDDFPAYKTKDGFGLDGPGGKHVQYTLGEV